MLTVSTDSLCPLFERIVVQDSRPLPNSSQPHFHPVVLTAVGAHIWDVSNTRNPLVRLDQRLRAHASEP